MELKLLTVIQMFLNKYINRTLIIWIFILPVMVTGCNSLSKDEVDSKESFDDIAQPRAVIKDQHLHKPIDTIAYVAAIAKYADSVDRHLKNFKLKTEDDLDTSAEGAELSYYFDATDTVKVIAIYYGETGKAVCSLYLKNGTRVLLSQKVTHYKAPIYQEQAETDHVETNRYTLKDRKIIQWIRNGGKVSTAKFKDEEAELKGLSIKVLR